MSIMKIKLSTNILHSLHMLLTIVGFAIKVSPCHLTVKLIKARIINSFIRHYIHSASFNVWQVVGNDLKIGCHFHLRTIFGS